MGDPNASIPTPQPVHYRPMFGYYGQSLIKNSVSFVSSTSLKNSELDSLGLQKKLLPVENCREGISKEDMIHNNLLPKIEVDPETYVVKADGELMNCEPAKKLSMAQRYFLY
jgi:urease subunit alpha